MDYCAACSMPLEKEDDCGVRTQQGAFCIHCVNPDKTVKTCQEIFDGGVTFFLNAIPGTDRPLAQRLVRKNMKRLPYWKDAKDECLVGPEATDEEFADALKRL